MNRKLVPALILAAVAVVAVGALWPRDGKSRCEDFRTTAERDFAASNRTVPRPPVRDRSSLDGFEVVSYCTWGNGEHQDGLDYEEQLPVTGPHYAMPLECAFHEDDVPRDQMVHALEHGVVGIVFDPASPPDQIRTIKGFVEDSLREDQPVFASPLRNGGETGVFIVAWGRRMRLPEFDGDTVNTFREHFAREAPEYFVGCG